MSASRIFMRVVPKKYTEKHHPAQTDDVDDQTGRRHMQEDDLENDSLAHINQAKAKESQGGDSQVISLRGFTKDPENIVLFLLALQRSGADKRFVYKKMLHTRIRREFNFGEEIGARALGKLLSTFTNEKHGFLEKKEKAGRATHYKITDKGMELINSHCGSPVEECTKEDMPKELLPAKAPLPRNDDFGGAIRILKARLRKSDEERAQLIEKQRRIEERLVEIEGVRGKILVAIETLESL